ncbi:MAG: class B sortase [Eubacterium sp.]|nr:class B sortase [Eubacterium sp.]
MKKIILNILIVIFALIFIGSGWYLFSYYRDAKEAGDKVEELAELVEESESEDEASSGETDDTEPIEVVSSSGEKKTILKKYRKLYKRNPDVIGWVKVDDTPINYPVMFTPEENEYYLHRNFDKQDDVNGMPFLDALCDPEDLDSNLLIYGHHMKSGIMFAHLLDYESEDFYKKHKIIKFDTLYAKGEYEIVAAFRSQVYKADDENFKYYEYIGHLSEKRFDKYIKGIEELSLYKTGIKPKYGEQLLSLVTCAYHVDEGRFVVVARKN